MPNINLNTMDRPQRVAYLDSVAHKLPIDDARKAASLISFYGSRGYLSEPQERLVSLLINKAAPELRDKSNDKQIKNFMRVIEVFDVAKANAYEDPKLKLGDKENTLSLTIGKPHSANPGMVYVKHNGEYRGKVDRQGNFQMVGTVPEIVVELLEKFTIDPQKMMRDYGYKTGKCCICSRMLTNKASIAAGIGPICSAGWGF